MTRICGKCRHQVEEDARFCSRCGESLSEAVSRRDQPESQDWVTFLGPGADYYMNQFQAFRKNGQDGFALTWNWRPFLFGWLWFLYRKMYLYAAVFLIGPLAALTIVGGSMEVLLVWGIAAGTLANYLYYGHVKRKFDELRRQPRITGYAWDEALSNLGGVQPYVWWLGIGIVIVALALGAMNPPPDMPASDQTSFDDV